MMASIQDVLITMGLLAGLLVIYGVLGYVALWFIGLVVQGFVLLLRDVMRD